MPVEPYLTPRQLRTIADRVEQLTKARLNNAAMGVPTTPNRFECRFPSGHRGTVTWLDAPLTSVKARERNDGQPVWRYVVQLHTPVPDEVEQIDPASVEAGRRWADAADSYRRDATSGR
ncbi:hypothetical protein PV383_44070 [Streptomyces caniscabiei]|uniref:Uncharacterized protein n=1 Tax=Streptomyces caniscabiei TaxID=2746961 RepID=A0ABU4N442_9ACTN|nr:hypothetical protein [Streptomyces caniscabiei]MDX3044092.1 hypothetical protein [Streptomyces caniscabiei]